MDYPKAKYELIFCIQEKDDSRLKMYVDSLRNKYPMVQAKVNYYDVSIALCRRRAMGIEKLLATSLYSSLRNKEKPKIFFSTEK